MFNVFKKFYIFNKTYFLLYKLYMFKKIFSFIYIKQIKNNFNFYINIFNFLKNKKIFNYYKNYITFYINKFNTIKCKLILFKDLTKINVNYILFLNKLIIIFFIIDFTYFLFFKI